MFDSSLDIHAAIQRIEHLLKTPASPVREEELRRIAQSIAEFLDRVDHSCMSPGKLAHLKAAERYVHAATNHGYEAELQAFIGAMRAYAAEGAVYLLRHPEKEASGLRSLTDNGVRQAKRFGDLLKEEILLSPKPVRIILLTSDIIRTRVFAQIITHINEAKKLGKSITVIGPSKDQRLFFGNNPDEFKSIYSAATKMYGQEEGDFRIVRQWLNRGRLDNGSGLATPQDAMTLGRLIGEGKLRDLDITRSEVQSFFNDGLQMAKDASVYTIVIGITHSMVFAAWLCNHFSKEEAGKLIPHTAEFAKMEAGSFYYRDHWY